ncbi:MAG: methyltransferase domain-containing protein [Candidatus Roizmanbacteria bacterium]|nr:MAG: methyltransferase domain-containing protein [Candidatus Roizmanbacteria bacterium]
MLDLETAKTILDDLYHDIRGYTVSGEARRKLSYHDKSYTYGEVTPDAFYKILKKAQAKSGEVFYDLGSGVGKPVILAYLLFDFSKCVGIEILPELYKVSHSVLQRLKGDKKIEFINEDFLHHDFSDADIIFTHSTCFYDELWIKIINKFEKLKPGTRIITVTKSIHSDWIKPLHTAEYNMGWGMATVHYYKKI